MQESIQIVTSDGFGLSVTRFTPKEKNGKFVIINSAVGVQQRFYFPFATYLSSQGFKVYTYDYRGIGMSRPASLKNFQASISDWGAGDFHAVLKYSLEENPEGECVVFGHSMGGQLIGMSPLSENIGAIVTIGSQVPDWRFYHGKFLKAKLVAFWYCTLPLLTKLFGYFPGKMIGWFDDLPKGVALQWASWARSCENAFRQMPSLKNQLDLLHQPALMISFSDDELAPKQAVEALMKCYQKLKWTHWYLDPDEVLQNELGHFSYFERRMESAFWAETLRWINSALAKKESKAA